MKLPVAMIGKYLAKFFCQWWVWPSPPTPGFKSKQHTHCMGIGQLCKNIEGDPAKPGFATTTCWEPSIWNSILSGGLFNFVDGYPFAAKTS